MKPKLLRFVLIAIAISTPTDLLFADVSFETDVEPLLRKHCFRCHAGRNEESGLRLDRAARILGEADSGEPLIVAGKPDQSFLLLRVSDESCGELMPLDAEPLKAAEIDIIRRWIAEGASLPREWSATEHWAYVAPKRIAPAMVDSERHAHTTAVQPIDAFISARLKSEGLDLAEQAPPDVLARRVSLALTGLPASREQVLRLRNDFSNETYEALVDELLSSHTFGQHWARHWLDLARYADSNGFQADQLRDAWAYRDWVIDAFNDDMPFDRFVIEQIAGDLLPDADERTRIATGFHRTPTCNVEAGVHPEANRVNQVFDRVNTTGTVFLGSTIECAQCHDHKYDPFSQEDYYRLFAFFNNTPLEVEKDAGVQYDFVGPTMDLPLDDAKTSEKLALQERLRQLRKERISLESGGGFDSWRDTTTLALASERPSWITPKPLPSKRTTGPFEVLSDNSVLFSGSPGRSVLYEFELSDFEVPAGMAVLAVRLDALQDDSLPGRGPGLGDKTRTNFVLHEFELSTRRVTANDKAKKQTLALTKPTASFSQAKYDVSGAIDGDSKSAWAIAPKFTSAHWAEFQLVSPLVVADGETLVASLDQHYGNGRVIGRPKISLRLGPQAAQFLDDRTIDLLLREQSLTDDELNELRKAYVESNPKLAKVEGEIAKLNKRINQIRPNTTLVMVEMEQPRETFVMMRGDYLAKGETVSPGTPASLHPMDPELPNNRLGLARWITDEANPLLARVTVNRFWMQIFGRGIVATPEDFGTQSEAPTHPELLDWLAIEFQSGNWSAKRLIKSIVMSETFRQHSAVSDRLLELDPENRLLGRGPRFRMSAEMIRDNALSVAGLLSDDSMGPPIMPYQPDGIWKAVGRGQPKWIEAVSRDRFRRGIYVVWKRSAPYPSFVTFDAPDRASCTVKRPRTNTPLQALVLLNDKAYAEAAMGLAARMRRECSSNDPESIAAFGYELATARESTPKINRVLVDLFYREADRLNEAPQLVRQRVGLLANPYLDSKASPEELAAWFSVASVLLNLDATITVN
ncbi:MAG: PSD1 and planctomycete cytochrome C domain-containing protein [Planctomycetota bacterium]